jgi:hypothetical protein
MVATWPGGIDSPPSVTLHNTCYRTLHMVGPVSRKNTPGGQRLKPPARPTWFFSTVFPMVSLP